MIIFDNNLKQIEFEYDNKNLIKNYKITSPVSFISNQFYKKGDRIIINNTDCYIKNANYHNDKNEYEICFKKSDIETAIEFDKEDYIVFDYLEQKIDNNFKINGYLFNSLYVLSPINFSTDNIIETSTDENNNPVFKFADDLEKYFILEYDSKYIDENGRYVYINPKLETLEFNLYFFKSYNEIDFSCPFKFDTKILLKWQKLKLVKNSYYDIQINDYVYDNGEIKKVTTDLIIQNTSNFTTKKDILGDGSCIAYYNFDDQTANDYDGKYNLTQVGGKFIKNQFGYGFETKTEPQIEGYLKIRDIDFLKPYQGFSFSMWIYPYRADGTFINFTDDKNDNKFNFWHSSNHELGVTINQNYYKKYRNFVLVPNKWYYVVVTQKNEITSVYFNGAKIWEASITILLYNPTNCLVFGQDQDTLDGGYADYEGFFGIYDEIRIFNKALSDLEVENLYNIYTIDKIAKYKYKLK